MKKIFFALFAACITTAAAHAMPAAGEQEIRVELEQVEHMRALGRMHSWRAIDNDTLIIWANAFDPYLIELSQRSPALRFARVIGVTESIGRVHSRFDSVIVDGFRYRIAGIYRISAEDARALQSI